MRINVDDAIVFDVVKAIDERVARLLATRAEILGELNKGKDDPPVENPKRGGKRITNETPPAPKRPEEVRRYVTQTDVVQVLEHTGKPMTPYHIKEQLDELLNCKPSDATLKNVLEVSHWKQGAKRYRLNGDGKYELYDPDEGEDA